MSIVHYVQEEQDPSRDLPYIEVRSSVVSKLLVPGWHVTLTSQKLYKCNGSRRERPAIAGRGNPFPLALRRSDGFRSLALMLLVDLY